MTSLHEDDLKDEMDGSTGCLVWVQRRNGSWWPGKILSIDELTKCLGTKKSGTPIKLLGREEGTVDFYNLEKSKRIKAFRCGEYDECIARAKASSICPNRNSRSSGKYVRRVDAIIHALELEKYYLTNEKEMVSCGKNIRKFSCITKNLVKQGKMMIRDPVPTKRKPCKNEEISSHELSHSIISFEQPEQPLNSAIHFIQKKRRKNPHGSEDDTDKEITKMKDLQDLDLIAKSTGKSDKYVTMKEACAQDPYGCYTQSEVGFNIDPRSSIRSSCSSSKNTRAFHLDKNLRRRNRRRRRLTKIWLDLDRVNVPVVYQHSVTTQDLPSYKISMERLDNLRSSKKTTISLEANSSVDFSESSSGRTSLHMHEKNGTVVNDFIPPFAVRDNISDGLSNGLVNVPILLEERNLEGVNGMHKLSRMINSIAAEELSIHSIDVFSSPKSTERLIRSCSTGSISLANHAIQGVKKSNINLTSNIEGYSNYSNLCKSPISESCDESLATGVKAQTMPASTNSDKAKGFAFTHKFLQTGKNLHSSFSSSSAELKGALEEVYAAAVQVHDSDKYRQSPASVSPQCAARNLFNSSNSASLCDVELKVQANYHGQRAPLVSLVSKLNGKAIVGHAIAVEVLGDGFSTDLLRKRANMVYKLHENLDMEKPRLGIQEKTSNLSYTASLLKRKPVCGRKYGLSPRKIRRLSAITFDIRENSREDTLEKRGQSSVSCIPIRVIFSRLNSALSCSSH